MKKTAISVKAIIGINLAIVITIVKIFEVLIPILLITDKKITKQMLINVFCPSNAGKVWIRSFAKPAAIAAHAIIVTNHPRTPTLNPIKSPNAVFEY